MLGGASPESDGYLDRLARRSSAHHSTSRPGLTIAGRVWLGPTAQEVEEFRLQIRVGGWLQLGTEDVGLTDHGVHRLESLVGPANGVLVEALARPDRSRQVPGMDEHVHGHELADDLTRRHLARRPVHLLGPR